MYKMGRSQREKGAKAERELAKIISEGLEIEARRGQVFNHEPDIVANIPVHWECKRQETTKIHEWIKQAKEAATGEELPVVAHRRSHEEWLATLPLKDLLAIMKEAYLK